MRFNWKPESKDRYFRKAEAAVKAAGFDDILRVDRDQFSIVKGTVKVHFKPISRDGKTRRWWEATIDEQESVTAWDVLQKCLTTYRCECIIHSLTKTIDIYDRIGSDKGCYFMEGLNLRKISLKSDTYDFYTRIYPIGKDGITPEWLTGKDYIDNFQYSSKIKAYVWKDERYTNTTSLIEDATAKIEEMSRPYK